MIEYTCTNTKLSNRQSIPDPPFRQHVCGSGKLPHRSRQRVMHIRPVYPVTKVSASNYNRLNPSQAPAYQNRSAVSR